MNSNNEKNIKSSSSLGKVLVVDDEADLVEILTDYLNLAGFEARGITNPLLALSTINEFKPDAVLSDFSMPQLSGVQLARVIHEVDSFLPVIFISGYLDKTILMDSINLGIFNVIEKPFNYKTVIQTTKDAVERYQNLKLLKQSFDLFIGNYASMEEFLKLNNISSVPENLKEEIANLYLLKNKLIS